MTKKKIKKRVLGDLIKNRLFLFGIAIVLALVIVGGFLTRAASVSESIAKQAESYATLGIKESPAKSNRSTYINSFNRKVGASLGSPWCASFVSTAIAYAGGDKRLKSASTVTLRNQYKSYHKLLKFSDYRKKLVRGDILFRERPSGKGHVGVFIGYVYKKVDGTNIRYKIKTVEGNTSCAKTDTNGCLKIRYYYMDGSRADYTTSAGEEGTYLWESVLRY